VAFTCIDEFYGPFWGTIAGIGIGLIEVAQEWIRFRKVERITWISNLMIVVLGAATLFSENGFWFKMQPAILEFGMASVLWISSARGLGLLTLMALKQNPDLPVVAQTWMQGLNARLGVFLFMHGLLATWAALEWTTVAWALLKGVGLTVSLVIYLVIEILWFRRKLKQPKL